MTKKKKKHCLQFNNTAHKRKLVRKEVPSIFELVPAWGAYFLFSWCLFISRMSLWCPY